MNWEVPQVGDRVLWIGGGIIIDGIIVREPMEGEDTGFGRTDMDLVWMGGDQADGWIRRDVLCREDWQKRLI